MNVILPPPSLEYMALVKIVVSLWSVGDVRYWEPNSHVARTRRWKEEEIIILKKASELSIPLTLKEKMLEIIGPVGEQILSWIVYHRSCGYITNLPSILLWTPHGTIDSKRTAEVLVKNESLHVDTRFALACSYCLVDDIIDLRKKCFPFSITLLNNFKTSFWCTYLEQNDDVHRMQTIVDNFQTFAHFGNEISIRYFFFKLRSQNNVQLRMKIVKDIAWLVRSSKLGSIYDRSDVHFYSVLCIMNAEEQTEIFERYTYAVLKSLLIWPRHILFLKTAKGAWSFLSKECYRTLLYDILRAMNCRRNYLRVLFKEFWLQTPVEFQQFITNGDDKGQLLLMLCEKGDAKNFQLILKNSCILARKEIIFSHIGRQICKALASSGKWDSVEYLIQECMSSPEEMIAFKDKFRKYM